MVDESVMTRVMKLLALANDEGASPHERKLAEERADKLMAQHMIDRFEATQRAKRGDTQARKPIQVEWLVQMDDLDTDGTETYAEFSHQVIEMMKYVLEHCGARVNPNYKFVGGAHQYKIVGFQEDIMYAERIWFNVFKTFVTNVNPKWDLNKSIEYNAYLFASAGISWKNMVLVAEVAADKRIEWPRRWQDDDESGPDFSRYSFQIGKAIDPGNEPWGRSIHKLKRACKKYCDENGLDYPYARGSKLRVATRNSFARSYRATISSRLDAIRKEAIHGEDHVDAGKFALAVRDTKEQVDEEFKKLFPEFDPDVQARRRAAEEAQARLEWSLLSEAEKVERLRQREERNRNWERAARRARRNYGAIREDPADRVDAAAWARGEAAAKTVNLRADEEVDDDERQGVGTRRGELS